MTRTTQPELISASGTIAGETHATGFGADAA